MTRKQVIAVIADNPNVPLYVRYTAKTTIGDIGFHSPISKTRAIRIATKFSTVAYGTYSEQRPDLDHMKLTDGDRQIITFVVEGA